MSTPIYADLQAFVRTTGRICVVKAPGFWQVVQFIRSS